MAVEIAPRITVDKKVRFGRPVIKGTRVPVTVVLEELAAGLSTDEIVNEYGITPEDVQAVLRYAAKVVGEEEIHQQLPVEGRERQL
ncbi:MAG: DUF433 domain-containing protein [Acidobacteriota bacterium]|nr:DUF433 domain-containing protein [Blastocatellia bacterium]MDW8238760.1 DUF433 domain-containing protein [Acidobacteriota bacterium]